MREYWMLHHICTYSISPSGWDQNEGIQFNIWDKTTQNIISKDYNQASIWAGKKGSIPGRERDIADIIYYYRQI